MILLVLCIMPQIAMTKGTVTQSGSYQNSYEWTQLVKLVSAE